MLLRSSPEAPSTFALPLDGYGNDDLITVFFLNAIGSALVAAWIAYDRRPLPLLAGLGVVGHLVGRSG